MWVNVCKRCRTPGDHQHHREHHAHDAIGHRSYADSDSGLCQRARGHVVYYDEDGLHAASQRTVEKADGAAPTVAFVGDSFVEALQVSQERSFVGRLEAFASGGTTVRERRHI